MKIATYNFTFSQGDSTLLDDESVLEQLLRQLVSLAGLTALSCDVHHFEPQGISAVMILAESHIALHTWPETQQGYVLISTCRQLDDQFLVAAQAEIAQALNARITQAKELR